MRPGRAWLAGALAVLAAVAVTCSSATGAQPQAPEPEPAVRAAAPSPTAVPSPVPAPTPEPEPPPGAVEPGAAPAPAAQEATRTPIPPRRGRTPTPTPVYRAPESRTDGASGLGTTADNITDLYDPLQPEGDREIGYGQYRPGVPRDSITPIYVPRIRDPGDLQTPLAPEELVMGVEIGGEARAYPIGLMRFREMANDRVGGVPILVTW